MSKIRYIVVLLFLTCYYVLQIYSAPKANTDVVIKHRIDSLEFVCKEIQTKQDINSIQLNSIQTSLNSTQQIFSSTVSSVSTQIDASNKLLNTWGFILAVVALAISILGFFLGNYIRNRANMIKTLTEQGKETEKSIKGIQNSIDSNISDLYKKLRREETSYILKRLQQVPEDIANFGALLLSRDLDTDDYSLLLKAYLHLLSMEQDIRKRSIKTDDDDMFASLYGIDSYFDRYKSNYIIIFFQHFLNFAIQENTLQREIVENFKNLCDASFQNDIIKSTHDLLHGIEDLEEQLKQKIIIEYIIALSKSRHNDANLYNDIITTLQLEQFGDIWKEVAKADKYVVVFAQTLLHYMQDNNINNEPLSTELNTFISTKTDK